MDMGLERSSVCCFTPELSLVFIARLRPHSQKDGQAELINDVHKGKCKRVA